MAVFMGGTNTSLFLQRPLKILSFFGIWQWSKRNLIWQSYMIFIMLTQYTFVVFEIVYIAVVWGDIEAVAEASHLLFTQASVCYKSTAFMANEKYMDMLLNFMESEVFSPKTEKQERILTILSQRIKNLCLFFLISACSTCTLWALVPILNGAGKAFPFKIWMPVTTDSSPSFELGYLYQMIAIYISALLFISVDSVALCMMMFGCAQLEILMDKLEQIQSVPAPATMSKTMRNKLLKSNNKQFIECVRQHQAVVGFIEIVENTFHANIFFQLMGTVGIICNIALRITMVKNDNVQLLSMMNYMVTMLSQLFIYCWTGHELTIRSEVLRDCLYQCPWYEQDIKYLRGMWIAMERMKKPIIFKAGHYVPLSRPTFVSILRCSYSYFAVLNSRE